MIIDCGGNAWPGPFMLSALVDEDQRRGDRLPWSVDVTIDLEDPTMTDTVHGWLVFADQDIVGIQEADTTSTTYDPLLPATAVDVDDITEVLIP